MLQNRIDNVDLEKIRNLQFFNNGGFCNSSPCTWLVGVYDDDEDYGKQ